MYHFKHQIRFYLTKDNISRLKHIKRISLGKPLYKLNKTGLTTQAVKHYKPTKKNIMEQTIDILN
jgi:hypothetical protein